MDSKPTLYPDLKTVWDAWHRLSGSRQINMGGVGPIPFTAIDRYAERYGIDDFEDFHRLIMAMDSAYMQHANRKDDA